MVNRRSPIMRIATIALALCLIMSCAVFGSVAKYTSSAYGSDVGTVAKWEVKVNGDVITVIPERTIEFDLFGTVKEEDTESDEEHVATAEDGENTLIAPGTGGSYALAIENNSQVNAKYSIMLTETQSEGYVIPIEYSVDGLAWSRDLSNINAFLTDRPLGMTDGSETITIYWRWRFDADMDADDVELGVAARSEDVFVTIAAEIVVVQVDELPTPSEPVQPDGTLPEIGVDPATREITDSWEQIQAAVDTGVYSTRYQVGDTKTLNHATLGEIVMQIVAFDRDIKGDGSGNAAITWISKDIITTQIMRDELDGSDNVWGSTDLYMWCQNEFFPGLPQDVRDSIVTVQKTSYDNWEIDTVVTNYARFWIPSLREVMGDDRAETSGVDYTDFFTDAESRIKYNANGEAAAWWLRSAGDQLHNMDSFWLVTEDGQTTYDWRHYEYGVVIGFCTD